MENILQYIISFNKDKSYYYSLLSSGKLRIDDEGYYLDAELLDFNLDGVIHKLYELYDIFILRIFMPDGFYRLEYDPGFGRVIWVYEDDRYRRWKLKGYNRGTIM